ncbi:hypothetical protein HPB50_003057 [Hyalomma asiaticum]|uniref:Uncharacterized protein n=1 Tax=Hyalomma asiaticum TaxID=266040 RepID=A0ACB7SHL0_HYAAI|nr:hypothetical protein HPB50_003057 [Hyalomma asiaticum]
MDFNLRKFNSHLEAVGPGYPQMDDHYWLGPHQIPNQAQEGLVSWRGLETDHVFATGYRQTDDLDILNARPEIQLNTFSAVALPLTRSKGGSLIGPFLQVRPRALQERAN